MVRALRPYPNMRDTELPWLGQVPAHWEVRRNGRLFAQRNETGYEDLPILEVSLRTGVRVRDLEDIKRKQMMTDRSKYKRAAKRDIAYNMMRMWQGAVGVAPVDGLVSPAYVVARPFSEVDPRYYSYLFRTNAYMREVNKFSRGIVSDRNRLYWDEFKQMPSVFPPVDEQQIIADFLDFHEKLANRLIRNKHRLITLLNEQKQAIINQAVTRGIEPLASTRQTGVYWMPEVPTSWNLKRLKFLARIPSGQVDPRLEEHRNKVLIAPNHIRSGTGEIIEFVSADEQGADSGKYEVRTGDIVYSKIRPHLRKAAISSINGLCSADMYPIRIKEDEINPIFFLYLLLSEQVTRYTNDYSIRVAMPKINREALGDCWLSYPSLQGQYSILEWIDRETSSINAAMKLARQEIGLLREYRERLVADVVTGTRDVRHIDISAAVEGSSIDDADDLDEEIDIDQLGGMEEVDAEV